jgi:hypothetical protein
MSNKLLNMDLTKNVLPSPPSPPIQKEGRDKSKKVTQYTKEIYPNNHYLRVTFSFNF